MSTPRGYPARGDAHFRTLSRSPTTRPGLVRIGQDKIRSAGPFCPRGSSRGTSAADARTAGVASFIGGEHESHLPRPRLPHRRSRSSCRRPPSRSPSFGLGEVRRGRRRLQQGRVRGRDARRPASSASWSTASTGRWRSPLVALLLLIVSFFAKIAGGVKWAGVRVPRRSCCSGCSPSSRSRAPVARHPARPQRVRALRPRPMTAVQSAKRPEVGATTPAGRDRLTAVTRSRTQRRDQRGRRRSEQGSLAAPARLPRHPRDRAAARLALAAEPDAVDVLRDGHGVPRLRRRPAAPSAQGHDAGDHAAGSQRRRPVGRPDRAGRRGRGPRRRARRRSSWPRAARSTATRSTARRPGPLIEVTEGDLVEVQLPTRTSPTGITLHWHGVDVPNAEDGVAGVTQDAVGRARSTSTASSPTRPARTGTTPTRSRTSRCIGGLLGPLVVHPAAPTTRTSGRGRA